MKKFPYLHLFLFVLTFLTTLIAGSFQSGANILMEPWRIYEGLPFSITLMTILLTHEFSHFFASRRHKTQATLPYFIPAPSLIGTFGAFIKMKSPITSRKALIDIGASGPIAGFIVSLIASVLGLYYSKVVPAAMVPGALSLGDSILFSGLAKIILGITPDKHDILLHPVAFAGWIGFFVTSLNLIPIGQLDGGHIAFALFGERHKYISMVLVAVLASLGIFYWEGWVLWAVLMLVLGLKHPPILYWETPIEPKRRFIGLLALVIFILTFIPSPFNLM